MSGTISIVYDALLRLDSVNIGHDVQEWGRGLKRGTLRRERGCGWWWFETEGRGSETRARTMHITTNMYFEL